MLLSDSVRDRTSGPVSPKILLGFSSSVVSRLLDAGAGPLPSPETRKGDLHFSLGARTVLLEAGAVLSEVRAQPFLLILTLT